MRKGSCRVGWQCISRLARFFAFAGLESLGDTWSRRGGNVCSLKEGDFAIDWAFVAYLKEQKRK